MKNYRPLYGLILAGGRSKRMGVDKASLVHPDGRPLAKRAADLLGSLCHHVVVSLRQEQESPPEIEEMENLTIVRDPDALADGPTVGIISAMKHFRDVDWLVVACDLPRLDHATLAHLIESHKQGELFLAYRSEFDGLPEPLCAIYAAESLALFERSKADGICCPRKLLIANHSRLLEPHVSRALDNANTPDDWRIATQL